MQKKKDNRDQQKVHIGSTKSQHFVKKIEISQKVNSSQIFKKLTFEGTYSNNLPEGQKNRFMPPFCEY